MKPFRALAFLLLTLPLLGGDGRTGEGGVWILPNFIRISSGWHHILQQSITNARSHVEFENLNNDLRMRLPSGVGNVLGTLHVPATGQVFGFSVQGDVATISSERLQELLVAGVSRAEVLLVDDEGQGLPILLLIDRANRSVDAFAF